MNDLDKIAGLLADDWSTRARYRQIDVADMDQAYRVAALLQKKLTATRGAVAGRKIALTSAAMQQMVGLDTPIAGAIFKNDVHRSPAAIRLSTFRHLGLEYELAFTLARPAEPGQGPFVASDVLDLVSEVRPAFELIEDKGADYADLHGPTLAADNAWCGGIVLGDAIPGWRDLDLAALPATLHQEGHAPETAVTGLADPLGSLAWVLNHFSGRGETVAAGEVIITGSVLRTRFPMVGDRLRYEIDGHTSVEVTLI